MNIFSHILLMCLMMIFFLIMLNKQSKNIKISKNLYKFLDKNWEFLTNIHRKKVIEELKSSIHIYSKFQIIQKISNADFISFFKYNYSKRYIDLDFLFSIDNNGNILQNSVLYNLPITGDLLIKNILASDCDLCSMDVEDLKTCAIYDNLIQRELNKIFYQNIFKYNEDIPLAFVTISYKDKDYILSDDDKFEIIRILSTVIDEISTIDLNFNVSDDFSNQEEIIDGKGFIRKAKKWLNNIFITGIIFSLFGLFIINQSDSITSNQIFSEYFKPYDVGVTRDGSYSPIEIGIWEYNNKDYAHALIDFEKCINKDSSEFVLFFAGTSALFNNEPDKALTYFSSWDKNSPFFESVEWYTVGCYLKNGDFKKIEEYLTKISNDSSSFYSTKASQLLKTNLLKK